MIDYNEILRGHGYWHTGMQLDLQESLRVYLENNKLTQHEFAERLGVSQSYISQVLNGNFDFRLSKMIELYLAIGKVPFILERDLEEVIHEWQQLARKNASKQARKAASNNSQTEPVRNGSSKRDVERKRASTPKRKVK
ncbi:MAG: helix-turn-helix transcriptional regulator [bacterium]|nr:helix-turn-helix transcriptional regulator [bacterium]